MYLEKTKNTLLREEILSIGRKEVDKTTPEGGAPVFNRQNVLFSRDYNHYNSNCGLRFCFEVYMAWRSWLAENGPKSGRAGANQTQFDLNLYGIVITNSRVPSYGWFTKQTRNIRFRLSRWGKNARRRLHLLR